MFATGTGVSCLLFGVSGTYKWTYSQMNINLKLSSKLPSTLREIFIEEKMTIKTTSQKAIKCAKVISASFRVVNNWENWCKRGCKKTGTTRHFFFFFVFHVFLCLQDMGINYICTTVSFKGKKTLLHIHLEKVFRIWRHRWQWFFSFFLLSYREDWN